MSEELKAFQTYVKSIKETSLKLEELIKMLESGDITENAYGLIIDELGDQLSVTVDEIFKLREMLDLSRARAKLEWAKEKIGLKELETPERQTMLRGDPYYHSPLYRWEELVSKIDAALSSLTMEEELSIIERYLALIKERLASKVGSEEIERTRTVCRQRLDSIAEKWVSIRRGKIEQVMNLELKASQTREETKEAEVRFAVGELDQHGYEYRMSSLQGSLKSIEREISETRGFIDEIDMKIFRCSEMLRENP